jgi:hypothetical protein
MTEKTTFVSFLLDETGSMQDIKDDTIGGFNAYVETLQKSKEDILFSLVSFNSNETRRRYVADPIRKVAPLSTDGYVPAASTPLIDAAVKIIKATDEAVRDRGDDPKVVIVMQTDGHENVSVEYTNADLAALIKEKNAAGWQFVFLGAGMDAFDAARRAGMDLDPRNVVSYSRNRSLEVLGASAENLSAFAESGDTLSLAYTPAQRSKVGDVHAHKYLGKDARSGSRSSTRAGKRKRRRSSTADDYKLS